jgi:hypothetical protein
MALIPYPFVGETDCDSLRDFLQPEVQYSGDTLWHFGKGLRGAYLDFFEYNEYMPVGFIWRDSAGCIGAVSCICARTGVIRFQASPIHRGSAQLAAIIAHGEKVLKVLHPSLPPSVYVFASHGELKQSIESSGYKVAGLRGIQFEHVLENGLPEKMPLHGHRFRLVDAANSEDIAKRAEIQTASLSDGDDYTRAWQLRNIQRSLRYTDQEGAWELVMLNSNDEMVAFVSVVLDRKHRIGEIRPLGAMRKNPQRDLLTLATLLEALHTLKEAGYERAVAKLDIDDSTNLVANAPSIEQVIAVGATLGLRETNRLFKYINQA